ncbi:unnamed protein product [Oncorhynchus mykiss]|uniref:Uncharacterized protein n=1 Tax=Oncorhynchus mykiss TaxID=8022 RepID=A0A060Y8A1_ONCMY|nr:unnamed protein product [Oncorhynchus mykiss]
MDSSWHNSTCFSPPKCQGSATPSQVRRRRRINNAISDPGREVSYCTTPTQTESPCVSPPNTPPPLTACTTQTQTDCPSTFPPPSTLRPSISSPPTVPSTSQTQTVLHYASLPKTNESTCTSPPRKSVLPPTVLPSKAQTTPHHTTQTEPVPPCTSLIQIKPTCTTTTTTKASIPNWPTQSPTPMIDPDTGPNCLDPKQTNVLAPYTAQFSPCTILTQTAPPCSSLNKAVIYCTSPPPTVTLCHPTTQTVPPYVSLIQTIPPGNTPLVPSYSTHIQIQTIKYCSSPSPIVKSCNSPTPMVKSYHTLPTGPSCATPTKTVPLYASTFRPAPPYTPPPQAQHCSTRVEWECRGERRILPPPPPPPPPYTPRKEGVSCTSGPGHRAPLLRRASEKEKSGRSGSPVHCPRACSLKHRAQTTPEVPLKGNQGDQGSSPTKAIPRPTCLGQAQVQLGAQIGALHKILCSGPNTPSSQHTFPPGQYPSGGCSGSGGGSSAGPLTSIQADTLRQVQEILGGLVSGARSKLDPTWVAEKLMGPNGPLHDIRSLQTQLHSLEGVLETSQNTIKVLLDVIQDLEKKEAERDG